TLSPAAMGASSCRAEKCGRTCDESEGEGESGEDREVVDISSLPGSVAKEDCVMPWNQRDMQSPTVGANFSTALPQAVLMHPRSLKRRRRCITKWYTAEVQFLPGFVYSRRSRPEPTRRAVQNEPPKREKEDGGALRETSETSV
ncbi:unnamed protein product, partial [Symbiodinium natans]